MNRLFLALGLVASACSCPSSGNPDGGDGGEDPCAPCPDPDSGYNCVEDGGRYCDPILLPCFFETCRPGEVCSGGKCVCLPNRLNEKGDGIAPDTCMRYGALCNGETDRCNAPGEMDWCTRLGGCQLGLDCTPVAATTAADGGAVRLMRCARTCSSNADCVHPGTRCETRDLAALPGLKNHCGWAFCPLTATGSTPLFGSCSGVTPASICYPFMEPAFEVGPTTYGLAPLCVPNGTAPSGGNCNPEGTTANLSELCPAYELCMPSGTGGYCARACNYGSDKTLGPACPQATGLCVNASNVSFREVPAIQLGACLKRCNLLAGTVDCTPNASGRSFGCQVHPIEGELGTGLGECLPLAPTAGSSGASCVATSANTLDRIEWPCGDRLYCTGMFDLFETGEPTLGTCQPYCDYTRCSSGQICPSTCPTPTGCAGVAASDAGPQSRTGFCLPPRDGGVSDAGPSDAGRSD